jgi:metal-sulfur cluster biosynthetic enzyme
MSENKTKKETIRETLEQVMDPEMNISIVDLGLVYEINTKKDEVHIIMTLTSLGCPLFGVIESDIKNRLQELGYKEDDICIELVFDPPWTMEKMSERAKAMIGI